MELEIISMKCQMELSAWEVLLESDQKELNVDSEITQFEIVQQSRFN